MFVKTLLGCQSKVKPSSTETVGVSETEAPLRRIRKHVRSHKGKRIENNFSLFFSSGRLSQQTDAVKRCLVSKTIFVIHVAGLQDIRQIHEQGPNAEMAQIWLKI